MGRNGLSLSQSCKKSWPQSKCAKTCCTANSVPLVPRSEFCGGNCLIPRDELDANCTVTDEAFEKFRKSVRFTGKKEEGIPRWEIIHDTGGSVRGSGRLLGEVACPCKHGNVNVTEDEALKRIVGQVAKLGIGERTAEAALGHETIKDKDLAAPVGWNAKVGLATYDMVKCWKSLCAGEIGENAGKHTITAGAHEHAGDNATALDALLDTGDSQKDSALLELGRYSSCAWRG